MFPVVEILVTFIVAFCLGCLAADMALRKKTGRGIEVHLLEGKGVYPDPDFTNEKEEKTITKSKKD